MPVRPPLYKILFSLKFEKGSYFLKAIKKILYTLEQIRFLNIQDPLWRHRCFKVLFKK